MLDKHRRLDLTRLVTEQGLTEADCDFLKASVVFHGGGTPTLPANFDAALTYAEKMLCVLGKKIPAIKAVRERTSSLGLREAKDLVDDWCDTQEYHDMKARSF